MLLWLPSSHEIDRFHRRAHLAHELLKLPKLLPTVIPGEVDAHQVEAVRNCTPLPYQRVARIDLAVLNTRNNRPIDVQCVRKLLLFHASTRTAFPEQITDLPVFNHPSHRLSCAAFARETVLHVRRQ
jgi:hypothetical protein